MFKKIIAAMIVALFSAVTAHAQTDRHVCVRVKDTVQANSALLMQEIGQPFSSTINFVTGGCKVKNLKAREICFPASAVLLIFTKDGNVIPEHLPGDALQNIYTCYKIKCDVQVDQVAQGIKDDLGTRTMTFMPVVRRVCMPGAYIPPIATTSTTTSTLP